MNKKKLLTTIIVSAIALLLLILLLVRVLGIHFNFSTYHSFEQDGYSFTFKGSSDTVRKLIVNQDGKKLCTLPFDASSDIFSNEFGYSARFEDIDLDGTDDLILPCAVDSDGDIHYSAFTADSSGKFIYNASFSSLSNLTINNGQIYTEEIYKETIAEETESSPEFYITTHKISRHSLSDGNLLTLEERSIIYYSENDYYCYSVYEYDEEDDALRYVDEKWFDSDDLEKHTLSWD